MSLSASPPRIRPGQTAVVYADFNRNSEHKSITGFPDGAGWVRNVSAAGEFVASLAVVVLAIALSPAISMIVGGVLFFDIAAERVEKKVGAPKGRMVPVHEALWNNVRIALPALVLNLMAIPLYFIPVVNAIVGSIVDVKPFAAARVNRLT